MKSQIPWHRWLSGRLLRLGVLFIALLTTSRVATAASTGVTGGAGMYLLNLTADSILLTPATNSLGTIVFSDVGGGEAYNFRVTYPNGTQATGSFFTSLDQRLDWVNVNREISGDYPIRGSISGPIKLVRQSGATVGTYQISGTPLGTVSGLFGIVRFSGVVTETSTSDVSGQLQGPDNPLGAPKVLGFGLGKNSDYVGTQAGMEFMVDLYTDGTVVVADTNYPLFTQTSWQWLRGTWSKLVGGGFTLTVQASPKVGGPWTDLTSLPIPAGQEIQLFRVVILKTQ